MIFTKDKRRLNTHGFTLTEVIVTIVILGILLGTTITGLITWQHRAMYKKNNEYAQIIFNAAQSALSHREAGGNLEELEKYVKGGRDGSGQAQDYSISYPRDLYYLDITMDEASDEELLKQNELYQLIKNYIYDKEIYNAAIRLEFAPSDGTVYAVSYTDRVNKFEYSQADGSDGRTMGINKDVRSDEGRRKKQFLGYYDTELSEEAPPGTYGKPTIRKAELLNEEALILKFSLAAQNQPFWSKYTYLIELYDDNDQRRIAFTLKADDFADSDLSAGIMHQSHVDIYKYKNTADKTGEKIPDCPIELMMNSAGEFNIVLDGVDYGAVEAFDSILMLEGGNTVDGKQYKNTYSFMRFTTEKDTEGGIPVDTKKVYAKVSASTKSYVGRKTASNKENPFMNEVKGTSSSPEYVIRNARHLYNIRFMEALNYDSAQPASAVKYTQKQNVIWGGNDGLVADGFLFDTDSVISGSKTSAVLEPDAPYYIPGAGTASQSPGPNTEYAHFPAIPKLGDNSTLSAKAMLGGSYQVKMLTLRETKAAALNDITQIENYALGLFKINEGTICDMIFTDIRADGKNFVGAVCGLNRGMLSDISVEADVYTSTDVSSRNYVQGGKCVGGIAGSDMLIQDKDDGITAELQALKTDYQSLDNEADVSGAVYLGGIVGASNTDTEDSESVEYGIKKCTNNGKVYARKIQGVKIEDSCYIGGIVGYKEGGVIQECNSSMGKETIADFLELQNDIAETEYIGDYAGGIVGYCTGGSKIINCNTLSGIITGRNFVGGIVGAQEISAEKPKNILDGNSGGLFSKNCSNGAIVIGSKYVGGIAGSNGVIENNEVVHKESDGLIIKNWQNKGIVLATTGYGGGITGANAGSLINCSVFLDISSVNGEQILEKMKEFQIYDTNRSKYKFTGGLAGYNCGNISAEQMEEVYALLAGGYYVGGVVGYNDVGAELDIDHYSLQGGYIEGEAFVGGAIGCNASESIFGRTEAEARTFNLSPNKIQGMWYVGGAIGGNIVAPSENIYLQCNVDNIFGTVSASCGLNNNCGYAGGFVGYNRLVKKENSSQIITEADRLCELAAETVYMLGTNNPMTPDSPPPESGEANQGPGDEERLKKYFEEFEKSDVASAGIDKDDPALYIVDSTNSAYSKSGINQGKGSRINNLSEVTGGVMVGGIVGGNDSQTKLTIRYAVNMARISSNNSIGSEDRTCLSVGENKYIPASINLDKDNNYIIKGETVRYSYTGGIIGLVNEGVVLDSCYNSGDINLLGDATYKGALAEINEGTILNCEAQSFGDNSSVYIGGITGRNAETGKIYNCSTAGIISGKAAVGGIAAENYGRIGLTDENNNGGKHKIAARINAEEICAGGVAGFNTGIIDGFLLTESVTGTASYIGGITGINYGTVKNVGMEGKGISVSGKSYAGGYIGYMRNLTSNPVVFGGTENEPLLGLAEVTVTGEQTRNDYVGNAGGLIGYIDNREDDKGIEVQYCKVTNKVTAILGNAGGITAYNDSVIQMCNMSGTVESNRGISGGITAVNGEKAGIYGCVTEHENDKTTIVTGTESAGGIAGENNGRISSCIVKPAIRIQNLSSVSGEAYLGGITGKNGKTGIIGDTDQYGCWVGDSSSPVDLYAYTSGCRVGGIAGENSGKIYGYGKSNDQKTDRIIYIRTHCGSDSVTGWFGGAVGINISASILKGVQCVGYIEGYNGSSGGFGGIAGQNESEISECTFNGIVRAQGASNDFVSVGGIAGKNTSEGMIKECLVGVKNRKIPEWARKESGLNTGEDTTVVSALKGKESCGYVGGIAGKNDGIVSDIKCKDATGKVEIQTGKGHIGGIIGYHTASGRVSNVENGSGWSVTANSSQTDDAAGGIIGLSASDYDASGLTNYAAVTKVVNNSNAVGGIIGRLENRNSSTRVISSCTNYGKITGKERVAGIIGNWKYKGGTLKECVNYGEVNIQSQLGAGIVGYLYLINSGETVQIMNSNNYGNIIGGSVCGGILSGIGGDTVPVKVSLIQCVNTGIIGGSGTLGGICARQTKCTFELNGCRNYGSAKNGAQVSGILAASEKAEKAILQNCYGVAMLPIPITISPISNNSYDNYFFTDNGELVETSPIMMEASINKSVDNNELMPFFLTDFNNGTRFLVKTDFNSKSGNEITLKFKKDNQYVALNTKYMQIAWYIPSKRTYSFEVSLKYEGENEFIKLGKEEDGKILPYTWSGSFKDFSDLNGPNLLDDNELNKVEKVEFRDAENFDSTREIAEIKIELTGGSNYFSIWDIYVEGITRQKQRGGSGTALQVKEENGKYNAYRGNDTYIEKLNENPCLWPGTGFELYTKIDPQLKQGGIPTGKLTKPNVHEINNVINPCPIAWDKVVNASRYDVEVQLFESATSETAIPDIGYTVSVPASESPKVQIPISSDWGGKYMQVFVKAISYYPSEMGYDSSPGYSNKVFVMAPLPTPEAHLEFMLDTDGIGFYALCLDNIDEYIDQDGKFYPAQIKVSSQMGIGQEGTILNLSDFDRDTGKAKTKIAISNTKTADTVWFQALTADKTAFLDSDVMTIQTSLFTAAYINTTTLAEPYFEYEKDASGKSQYITGTKEDDFGYSVKLILKKNESETYWRSEVLLFDENVGMDVVVASGENRVSVDTVVSLTDFPLGLSEKFLHSMDDNTKLTVRSYLWATQGYCVRYGSAKALNNEPILKEELNDASFPTVFDAQGKLKNGYFIELVNSDGEDSLYNIRYSTILEDHLNSLPKYGTQYGEKIITVKELKDKDKWQPSPKLEETYEIDNNTCIFTWDKGENYTKAQYKVILTGTSPDGTLKEIYPAGKASVIQDNKIELDCSNWNYKNLKLQVTRIGTTKNPGNGMQIADKLCSYSEKDYKMLLKLPQITQPDTPSLSENNRDNLNYDISWKGITDSGQQKDLKEYLIYADVLWESNPGLTEENKTELQESLKVFGEENLTELTEEDGSKRGIRILLGRKLKEDGDTVLSGCNLEELHGLKIEIHVKAIALASDDAVYTDSDEGVHRSFQVPERMVLPEDISFELFYEGTEAKLGEQDILTVAEFSKLNLTGIVKSEVENLRGSYKFEAAVYDGTVETDAGQKELIIKKDGKYTVNEEFLENGSITAAPICPENILVDTPNGTMNSSSLRLDSVRMKNWMEEKPGDLSGKYLIIRFRGVESSSISSVWSEYYVQKLPQLRLEMPQIEVVTKEETIGVYSLERQVLKWNCSEDTHISGFDIFLRDLISPEEDGVYLDVEVTTEPEQPPAVQVIMKNKEKEKKVTVSGTENDGNIVYTCKLSDWSDNKYKYVFYAPWDSAVKRNMEPELEIVAKPVNDGAAYTYTYNLVLPDISALQYKTENSRYLYTADIVIRAKAASSEKQFTSSFDRIWGRIIKDDDETTIDMDIFDNPDNLSLSELVSARRPGYQIIKTENIPWIIGKSGDSTKSAVNSVSGNSVSGNSISGNTIDEKEAAEESKTEKPSEDGKKDESGTGEPESETTESGTGETESETTGSPDEIGTEDNSTKTDIETEEKNESTTGSETQSHKLEETVSMHTSAEPYETP